MKKKLTTALLVTAGVWATNAANAAPVTYEFSFTAEDVLSAVYADGADGSSAADNSLFDGARLTRNDGTGNFARTYVQSQHSAFGNWVTTTEDRLSTLNLWGFDGRGAGWGEDFKHTASEMINGPANWSDWTTGWDAGWGANPNPYTSTTPGWYANSISDALGFGDPGLASTEFRFQMSFDTDDWLYGANTNGAPNTLGGPMTFWFGGWMGNEQNPYSYIYEGNLVLTGTQQVPLPATLLLLGIGLTGLGLARRRRR